MDGTYGHVHGGIPAAGTGEPGDVLRVIAIAPDALCAGDVAAALAARERRDLPASIQGLPSERPAEEPGTAQDQ